MAFTYNLSSADATTAAIAAVRLGIGDNIENTGVLPSGANLSDEEITYFLNMASGDVDNATLSIVRMLARSWATVADVTVGPRRESLSQVSARWQAVADDMRSVGAVDSDTFSFSPVREDGYQDAASA